MKPITVAEIKITEESYPNLYPIAKNDLEGLKQWLVDLKERTGSVSLEMTATILEIDLEHERLCNE